MAFVACDHGKAFIESECGQGPKVNWQGDHCKAFIESDQGLETEWPGRSRLRRLSPLRLGLMKMTKEIAVAKVEFDGDSVMRKM